MIGDCAFIHWPLLFFIYDHRVLRRKTLEITQYFVAFSHFPVKCNEQIVPCLAGNVVFIRPFFVKICHNLQSRLSVHWNVLIFLPVNGKDWILVFSKAFLIGCRERLRLASLQFLLSTFFKATYGIVEVTVAFSGAGALFQLHTIHSITECKNVFQMDRNGRFALTSVTSASGV